MNSRQLQKFGVPENCVRSAITAIQRAVSTWTLKGKSTKPIIKTILEDTPKPTSPMSTLVRSLGI